MQECWAEKPDQRPTFEQIRQRIATFLDVASDSYGYIQVSGQEYQRIYGHVEPPKEIDDQPSTSNTNNTMETEEVVKLETSSRSRTSSISVSTSSGQSTQEIKAHVYIEEEETEL